MLVGQREDRQGAQSLSLAPLIFPLHRSMAALERHAEQASTYLLVINISTWLSPSNVEIPLGTPSDAQFSGHQWAIICAPFGSAPRSGPSTVADPEYPNSLLALLVVAPPWSVQMSRQQYGVAQRSERSGSKWLRGG